MAPPPLRVVEAPCLIQVAGLRAIVLVGLMGSGKSQIGAALARRLGWRFVDTDVEVVTREGRTIAAIFRDAGEARFRTLESDVLRQATRSAHTVIATGGGAVLSAANRRRMQRAGPVVYLNAPTDVLAQRLGDDPDRPLLGNDPKAALERLHRERAPLYENATLRIDAAGPMDEVVHEILTRLASMRRTVRVDLGPRAYDVRIGAGALTLCGFDLDAIGARGRVAIVTHRALARRFGSVVEGALAGFGFQSTTVIVPAGERAKSLRQAAAIFDALSSFGFDRAGTILGLGGGVIGDLAGFVAGTYMRGVRLIHLPTTLLAQIDSSIGGKTAVNHPRAKNLIGVFHQPALVIADVATVRSLPAREQRAGLAEAVKYGMTLDAEILGIIERHQHTLPARWLLEDLEEVVFRCAALKAGVVEADEFERGPREVLNYGHTVGHAIEAVLPARYTHGEAIAIGMRVEAQIARRLGLISEEDAGRQDRVLAGIGLAVEVPAEAAIDGLLNAMRLDKKRRDGRIRCTLPEGIGRARLGVDVAESLMREVLRACQGSS